MSIRLKKVEWLDSESYSLTRIAGVEFNCMSVLLSKPDGEWKVGLFLGRRYATREEAKAACEQYALERIREAVEVDNGWRDISTAPKDKRILVWVSATVRGTLDDGSYYESDSSQSDFGNWSHLLGCWMNDMGTIGDDQEITHWMSLPKPPKEGEK